MRHLLLLLVGCGTPGPTTLDTDTDASAGDTDPLPDSDGSPSDTDTDALTADTSVGGPVALAPAEALCSDGWCWAHPLPHGIPLAAVHATASDDVWAVGAAGLVQRWDGRAWSFGFAPTDEDLTAVWVATPGEPCVAGADGVLLCMEAGRWVNRSPTTADLLDLSRSPGGHLWAVGPDVVLEHDGRRWTRHAGGGFAVFAAADDHVTVLAGDAGGGARRWDGQRWTTLRLPLSSPRDVDGTGPGDLWVVGARELAHDDGSGLRVVSTPAITNPGTVSAVRPGEVLVVDAQGAIRVTTDAAVRWPGPYAGYAPAAWIAPDGVTWEVGENGLVLRWDGSTPTSVGAEDYEHDRAALRAADPDGGVWFGASHLLHRDGAGAWTDLGAVGDGIGSVVDDGVDLWVGAQVSYTSPCSGWCSDPFVFQRRIDGGWDVVGHEDRLLPLDASGAVWAVSGGSCRAYRMSPGPGLASWPPSSAPFLSCELQVFEPGVEAWGAYLRGPSGGWSTSVGRADASGWIGWTWPDRGWVRRHPTTGEPLRFSGSGTWARVDPATGAYGPETSLVQPGEQVWSVADLPGEIVLLVTGPGSTSAFDAREDARTTLVRWDGVAVRRERLPWADDVRRLVRDTDGAIWASGVWAGLLVHAP